MKKTLFNSVLISSLLISVTAVASEALDNLNNLYNSDKFYIKYIITRDYGPTYKPSPYSNLSYRGLTEGTEIIIAKSGNKLLVTRGDKESGSIGDFFRELNNPHPKVRYMLTTIVDNGDAAQFIYDMKDKKYKSHITMHRGHPDFEACELKDDFDTFYGDFYSRVLNMYTMSNFTKRSIDRVLIPQSYCKALVETGQEVVDGETYDYEMFETKDGVIPERRKYYYKNNQLVRLVTTDGPSREGTTIESVGHNAYLTMLECKNDFDDSIFELPKGLRIIENLHWKNKILKKLNKGKK